MKHSCGHTLALVGKRLFRALLVTTFALGCVLLGNAQSQAGPQLILGSGSVNSDKIRRPFMLQTELSEAFGDQNLLGHFTILYFGYTTCPDVCPTSLMTMADVLDELGDDGLALTPLFISVDPNRDKLIDLREYTDAFHKRIIGLTGPKVMVDAAVDAYNARYKFVPSDDKDPMGYSIDHTASMAFIGPDARLIVRFGYGLPTQDIVTRIRAELALLPKLVKQIKATRQ